MHVAAGTRHSLPTKLHVTSCPEYARAARFPQMRKQCCNCKSATLHREKSDRTWQFHTSSPPLWATFTKMLPDLCSVHHGLFSHADHLPYACFYPGSSITVCSLITSFLICTLPKCLQYVMSSLRQPDQTAFLLKSQPPGDILIFSITCSTYIVTS